MLVSLSNGLANEKEIQENESLHIKLAIEILKEFLKPNFDFDSGIFYCLPWGMMTDILCRRRQEGPVPGVL